MKTIWILSTLLFVAISTMGQNTTMQEIPYIEVTGSADIEIEPDEIRLAIVISSYKKGKNDLEIKLEEVDKRLMDILGKAGITKSNVIMKSASTQGYWYYWWRYNSDDARLTKEYEVIFADYAQLNKVLAELPGPKEGFVNVNISQLKNKKIAEYRKQTKIEAMKAAKEKARYLLESVGQIPGKLIQVIELDEDDWGWYRPAAAYSNMSNVSQVSMNAGSGGGGEDPSMQKIKLRYRIKARFEIK